MAEEYASYVAFYDDLNSHFLKRKFHDFSLGEFSIINAIESSDTKALHISQICEKTGIARLSVTPILRGLEERSLIRRLPDDEDGRRYLVAMSDKFYEKVADSDNYRENFFKEVYDNLSAEDQANFTNVIGKIRKIIEERI